MNELMTELGVFGKRPDGNSIVTFFNRDRNQIIETLQLWGGRFRSLRFVELRDFHNPFESYCVGGSKLALSYEDGWTIHCDDSTTLLTGLPVSVARLSSCIAVRVTFPFNPCQYPCVRIEYYDFVGKERTRVVTAMLDGNRWLFTEEGDPLEFEEINAYRNRRIVDRLSVSMLQRYLTQLGCFGSEFARKSCDVYSFAAGIPANAVKN